MSYAIGIDLGGSSVKSVAVTETGRALAKENVDFDPAAPMEWAITVRNVVERLQTQFGEPAACIGASAPGLAAGNQRTIAYMPGRLHGLEGFVWSDYLGTARAVPIMNDAHSALLGENWIGAAKGFRHAIMLTLGTGVGGAAMVDGHLLRGHIGRAGHLGHTCLDPNGEPDICHTPGSLETHIGNYSIQQRSNGRFATTHDLVKAYQTGDAVACEIWLKSVKALAGAICSFINILDPEAVIIGGGVARAGSALFGPLQQFLDQMEWSPGGHKVKIVPAQLGEYAGAFGAAHNALQFNATA